jgi:hypothetical protein
MFQGLLQDGTILFAGYQFESFASGYPKSEVRAYLGPKSYSICPYL